MIFTQLSLHGAYEIVPERREDARGFFARIYCDAEFMAHGLNTEWTQMNLSFSRDTGTLRGMHFQKEPMAEVKLVRCLRGEVEDVIVDLREESETYGKYLTLTLKSSAHNAIYIPKGFAHGFQTTRPDTELQYFHSAAYAPGHEGGLNPFDADLGIAWPLPPVNVSERDMALPAFKDLIP